jgi:hypothetical protein
MNTLTVAISLLTLLKRRRKGENAMYEGHGDGGASIIKYNLHKKHTLLELLSPNKSVVVGFRHRNGHHPVYVLMVYGCLKKVHN